MSAKRNETASARGAKAAAELNDAALARQLVEYADEIQRETGRAYAPAFMREAARRLATRLHVAS